MSDAAEDYRLLDSGNGRRLEQVGPVRVDRQASQALWRPRLPRSEWDEAHARHHRSDKGGGHWETRASVPATWSARCGGLTFETKLTPFGHLGLFPEHAGHWSWLEAASAPDEAAPEVLNLFAYTGGASLVCAKAGARVCHVDAAKGVVDWARRNAARNGLEDRPVRWIVEDCRTFVERELRRGRRYSGLILDPPTYGRGPKKEVWKIEEDLPVLLEGCARLLVERPRFVLFTCHTPGFSPLVLRNLLAEVRPDLTAIIETGEMELPEPGGRALPAGAHARIGPKSNQP